MHASSKRTVPMVRTEIQKTVRTAGTSFLAPALVSRARQLAWPSVLQVESYIKRNKLKQTHISGEVGVNKSLLSIWLRGKVSAKQDKVCGAPSLASVP